ncbi:MAG: GntR family transcriptional regulator [Peptostreptococcaceae bacterium]|nr:GntR family transcriptional regulator [Peptostreptococcaceae bacterium]
MKKATVLPVYMKIAIDVAGKISRKEIKKESKISGRSTLSSEYNVSPETIRKAMALLSDMEIIEVKHGKGIFVSSYEQAEKFIESYKTKENITDLRLKIKEIQKKHEELNEELNEATKNIIDYSIRFKNNEYIPIYEEPVLKESWVIGKSIKELLIWQNTGSTILGIKRKGHIQISPGPYECFKGGDEILFVGDINSGFRLNEFLNNVTK